MEHLENQIKKYNKEICKPDELKKKRLESDSWFDINFSWNSNKKNKKDYNFNADKLPTCDYKCKKVILLPTKRQRKILLKWLDIYIRMYNETIKVIKKDNKELKKSL